MWPMTQVKGRNGAIEAEGTAFQVEPLDGVEGLDSDERPVARLRERLGALEKELDAVERGYESRLADLTRRLAEADAREAERKAALKDLLSKLA